MASELEDRVRAALREESAAFGVPPMPPLPPAPQTDRRRVALITGAVASVAAIAVVVPIAIRANDDEPDPTPPSPSPTSRSSAPDTISDLPAGDPPRLAYVVAGSSIKLGRLSVDLEWEVTAITPGSRGVLVTSRDGMIDEVGTEGIRPVAASVTAPPVIAGIVAWIEGGQTIVRDINGSQERQPLPAGCCTDAAVVGIDVDMDPDVYVTTDAGAWLWDIYEGGEGTEDPPPESDDYFWPIAGLGTGTLDGVGIGSEVLVSYPDRTWGWGYVAGPREPGSTAPVRYEEKQTFTAKRVWLTSAGIVAADADGHLSVHSSDDAYDGAGHLWRELTGERSVLNLPARLEVRSVVAESRRTVLIDATDRTGARAWVRCHTDSAACELAADLGPGAITPTQ